MITAERLRKLLDYDPEKGVFRWKIRRNQVRVGDVAGSPSNRGYHVIRVDRRTYLAHRLAWLYVNGVWPVHEIDHKNRIRDDNRIDNLREATDLETSRNGKLRSTNTSGFTGVTWSHAREKWESKIRAKGRSIWLGRFDTPGEARAAYCKAAIIHHGEFAGIAEHERRIYSAVLEGTASLIFGDPMQPAGWL